MKQVIKTTLIVSLFATVSCNIKSKNNDQSKERKQKIVQRDNKGRIKRTFDGYIYRIFDSLGRQIKWYGNYKNEESHSNIHNFVEYSDSVIIAKEYVLEDSNTECRIVDSLDCFIAKYYYKKGDLTRREYHKSVKNESGKVISYKLIETDNSPRINPFVHSLPSYLQ